MRLLLELGSIQVMLLNLHEVCIGQMLVHYVYLLDLSTSWHNPFDLVTSGILLSSSSLQNIKCKYHFQANYDHKTKKAIFRNDF